MARPRKYVQVRGITVDGVHHHRATHRYYIFDGRGKQVYFRDLQAASDAYQRERGDPVAVAKERAAYALRHAAFRRPEFFNRLAEMFRSEAGAETQLDVSAPEHRLTNPDGSSARDGLSITPFADSCGVPRFRIVEEGREPLVHAVSNSVNPNLRQVGEAWCEGKRAEAGLAKKGMTNRHLETTLRLWKVFTGRVGNLRISELRPEHFRSFQQWADLESTKKPSAHWQKRLFVAVKGVLNFAQERYPEWAWSSGISDRVRTLRPKPHEPGEQNAEPMPAAVFRRLLDRCDVWAATEVEEHDPMTQAGRARREQAMRKRREGRQLRAMLMLSCNCGLNVVDLERMRWSDLHLDHEVPHLDLPRVKAQRRAGRPIVRRTPLLPQVVEELGRWRQAAPPSDGRVFSSAQGTAIKKNALGGAVGRLLDELGLDHTFTFKHLRNCGPTLAANAGLPEEMIERFLGHKPSKVSSRYKGVKPIGYLRPVVELIGREYFGAKNRLPTDLQGELCKL